jgi:hypothetical protein
MRIECALCPYISEDEDDFENHFMSKHSPVEKSLIHYMVELQKKIQGLATRSSIFLPRMRTVTCNEIVYLR